MTMDKVLKRTLETLRQATQLGFVWPDDETLLSAVQSEFAEIEDVLAKKESPERLREELGDLLFGCIELCRYFSIAPAEALNEAEEKFRRRFQTMMALLEQEGKTSFLGESLEKKVALWAKAKQLTRVF